MRTKFKSTKIPTTITGQPYVKRSSIPKRTELEHSVITKATETSSQEIIKNDEAMFKIFEPKTRNRFLVKITDSNGYEVIPSYCIKSIDRPEFVKSLFGYKLLPINLSCYDPISPMIEEGIQFYLDSNIRLTVVIKVLGPVGDVAEEWTLKNAKILRVKYSNLDWCETNPVEVSIQIQAKTAKLTIK